MRVSQPSRGEVWLVNLNPTRGHEQAGIRPALVVCTDLFNHGPAGSVVVLPLTTRHRDIPLHVVLEPPEGGIPQRSYVKTEDVRSIAAERLMERWGTVTLATMDLVGDRMRILLEL